MAKATVKEVVVEPVKEITLVLTEEEAKIVRTAVGTIGGSFSAVAGNVWDALQRAGVRCYKTNGGYLDSDKWSNI